MLMNSRKNSCDHAVANGAPIKQTNKHNKKIPQYYTGVNTSTMICFACI